MRRLTFIFIFAIILSCNTQLNRINKNDGNNNGNTIVKDNSSAVKNGSVLKKYLGTFRVSMTGFTGTLNLYKIGDKFSGNISFPKWGSGKKMILKDVKINNGKIYFLRSLTEAEDLKKYNSTRYFNQNFYGTYSKDASTIKGYYRDSGAQQSWKAVKVSN